jgi:hypothetical protein
LALIVKGMNVARILAFIPRFAAVTVVRAFCSGAIRDSAKAVFLGLAALQFQAATLAETNIAVVVRHGVSLNGPGRIEGSMQQLLGEGSTFNSGFVLSGDFYVPGTPSLILNGSPTFSGTVAGDGSAFPAGYSVVLNGGVTVGYLRTRPTLFRYRQFRRLPHRVERGR